MSSKLLWVWVLLLASFNSIHGEVFIVSMDLPPVIHYHGFLPSFPSTALHHGSKLDIYRPEVQIYDAYLTGTHDNLLANAFPNGDYTKLYSYRFTINAFSVVLTPEQAATLKNGPGVVRVELDTGVTKATTHTPYYLGLPKGLWAVEGGVASAGEGIVIGIVDTGINPFHPSFANTDSNPYGPLPSFTGSCEVTSDFPVSACNGKLIGARHFAAAAIASGSFNATLDFASPLDGDGHGTHTASTAGGNHGVDVLVQGINYGKASGMAPRARIAMYKVLYRYFGGFFADVVAGIEQATADGVDVLSLSIAPSTVPTDVSPVFLTSFDISLLGAVHAGVFVTQAAGNSGSDPRTVVSFSPWIFSVAAGSIDRTYSNSLTLGSTMKVDGSGLGIGTDTLRPLVYYADAIGESNNTVKYVPDCQSSNPFDKEIVKGKIMICEYDLDFAYGYSTVLKASKAAQNLSAAGVIFLVSPLIGGNPAVNSPMGFVPGIIIGNYNETEVVRYYYYISTTKNSDGSVKNFGATANLNGGTTAMYSGAAPMVASFSSRGPDVINSSLHPADVLKPNILAPGVNIWAAWSPIGIDSGDFMGENFALISGTSMATPHIAGIAALLKQKNPSWSPAVVASALATTAYVKDYRSGGLLTAQQHGPNGTTVLVPASPFAMGSGHVNATAALDPGLVFDAGFDDYMTFLCTMANSTQVQNATGEKLCERHVPLGGSPSDLNTPSITIAKLDGFRVIPRTVTNVASTTETYSIEIDNPWNVFSTVFPPSFTIDPGMSQQFLVTLTSSTNSSTASFGSLTLVGSSGHSVRIPISVIVKLVF